MSIRAVLAHKNASQFAIALSDLVAHSPRGDFEKLRPAEQVAWCVTALEREIDGGGFEQFYQSSAGDQAEETVTALKTIGALAAAKIVARANALMPGGGPAEDQSDREEQIDSLSTRAREKLEALSELFMEYPDDLPVLLRKYVSGKVADFE
jgi:hypothetical protein